MPRLRIPDLDGDLLYDVCNHCHEDICDEPNELFNLPHEGRVEHEAINEAVECETFSWEPSPVAEGTCCDACGRTMKPADWSGDRHAC